MSLLKPRLLVRRKALLLTVSLLLALPCVAVASFGMRFDLKTQPPQNFLQEPTETQNRTRKARAIYHTWPEYPEDARAAKVEGTVLLSALIGTDGSMQDVQVTKSVYPSVDASAVAAVRQWRFEPALKDGQPVSTRISIELVFSQKVWEGQQKEKEHRIVEEREMKEGKPLGWAVTEGGATTRENVTGFKVERDGERVYGVSVPQGELESRRREEREQEALQQAELAKAAKITMDQAIQIARGQNPGTVLECSLVGEHWEAPGRLSKESQVLYHVVILSSNDSKTTMHVLVNALDGRIVTVDKRGRERDE